MSALATAAPATVVLDRIAAVAGTHAILTSDIDREIRVGAFLNGEKPVFSSAAKHQSASRLVDQQIIRNEIETGDYARPPASDVDAFIRSVVKQRFGTQTDYDAALRAANLTQTELRSQLAWQLTVLRFIDQRFRPTVVVSDDDVRNYYDQHRSERSVAYQMAEPKIRAVIESQRINEAFFAWLDEQRKQIRVEYREAAFQS
jgi:peptidyl-prolyl cis-trans isomerase SurA